jgi:predicted RNase H-like HicB family nuclease
MAKMSKKDEEKIRKYRALFPGEVYVTAYRSEEGGFGAEVITFPGLITEAETFSDLISMVNDALYTYFDIPDKYVPFMPSYNPPVSVAQALTVFPVKETTKRIKLLSGAAN